MFGIDPLIAAGVILATAATDAVYVMFTSTRGGTQTRARGDLEQHLVSAFFIRRHQLHLRRLALGLGRW